MNIVKGVSHDPGFVMESSTVQTALMNTHAIPLLQVIIQYFSAK